ncbi:conserved hypothetical protein [Neospora caninum Liverpool]|uniref:Uncharacterized protein n=1 Tax=Neospora caninum (strain Liverpool) TaxID=572307 RepID=F0VMX7_NEOCL|nr:conserved hypothetical protein [Neospora caninum Liverpool]CBZ55073.1 conserved hypothetical protein [Neospora caninum Liverpool]CEL69797.1 TPA: hypothetical protein BN1204_054980 [Neospora caninum Liverpool]|eukprot:XP_003885101.1 conserved hypothetical protein [Neospora caninum Liverpool]
MKLLVTGFVTLVGTAQAMNLRPNLGILATGGPYATIVDVHKGTACLLDESRAGSELVPPQCGCSFKRLAAMKEKCAALSSTATSQEAEECATIPCEICCVMRSAAIPIAGEDRTHLECKKKCPNSEEILPVTEDVSIPVFRAAMDLTDVFYAPSEVQPEITVAPSTPQAYPAVPPSLSIAMHPASTETTYPLRTLPSEEDLATVAPISPQQLDSISRAHNAAIEQNP